MTEPTDEAWLLAREGGDTSAHPSVEPARAETYARLDALLQKLPEATPASGWQNRMLDALPLSPPTAPALNDGRSRRVNSLKRIAWAGGLAAGLSGLVLGAFLVQRPPTNQPDAELMVEVLRGTTVFRGSTLHVGDVLRVGVAALQFTELRVYHADGALVARCPGGDGCSETLQGTQRLRSLTLTLSAPGVYRVVSMTGAVPAPTGNGFDDDLLAADNAGVDLKTEPPLEVQ